MRRFVVAGCGFIAAVILSNAAKADIFVYITPAQI
jgi:saccharopine dehydrogenase-like NADP-dependent oxidoreductase